MNYIFWLIIILIALYVLLMVCCLIYIFCVFVWGIYMKLSGKDENVDPKP